MDLPVRERLGLKIWRNDGGWGLRLFGVFFCLFVYWNLPDTVRVFRRQTGVILGFVGTGIRRGDVIPCRKWMRYFYGK